MATQRIVRVPHVVVQALLVYLDDRPHKEVRQFIDLLSGLPPEEVAQKAETPPKE